MVNNIEIKIIPTSEDLSMRVTKEEFEIKAWENISELIKILILNGYNIKLSKSDIFVVIQFDHASSGLTDNRLEWVDCDDYELLLSSEANDDGSNNIEDRMEISEHELRYKI